MKTGLLIISIKSLCIHEFQTELNWCKSCVLHRALVSDRCNLSVIHEIYANFTLLLPEFYQRNPSDEHVFILTLCPPNSGKTNDTVFNMVYLIKFHVCAKQVGEPYTLGSSNYVFHIILDFI